MPQPYLVPVRPTCSRIAHKSGVSGSTSTLYADPLMVRPSIDFLPFWCRFAGAMSSAVGCKVFSPGILLGLPFATSPRSCASSHSSARRAERSCERLVAQDSKGGERDGNLDDDRADRQEPDFALGLPIHIFPRLVDPQGYEGTGEAHHEDARSCCGDQVN